MKNKTILSVLVLTAVSTCVFAQGKWEGESSDAFVYKFEESSTINKKSKFKDASTLMQSVSSTEKEGFLPKPPSGFAKVSIEPNTGAWFGYTVKKDDIALRAIASSSAPTQTALGAVSKFSVYGIESSPVSSFFFTLDINAFAKDGMIAIPFGNSPANAADNSNTFNDAKQMSIWWDNPNLFGAIKLDVYDGFSIAYSYRKPRMGKADKEAPQFVELKASTPFVKGKSHNVELYCNNSTASQAYMRDGKSYSVEPQTYNWWVNDQRVELDKDSYSFPSSNETAVGSPINSISINSSGNTNSANSLEVGISNLSSRHVN